MFQNGLLKSKLVVKIKKLQNKIGEFIQNNKTIKEFDILWNKRITDKSVPLKEIAQNSSIIFNFNNFNHRMYTNSYMW